MSLNNSSVKNGFERGEATAGGRAMILWPCSVCRSTDYCFHREHDLVAFAIALAGESAEVIPDPLPDQPIAAARKPPARERPCPAPPLARIGGGR